MILQSRQSGAAKLFKSPIRSAVCFLLELATSVLVISHRVLHVGPIKGGAGQARILIEMPCVWRPLGRRVILLFDAADLAGPGLEWL